MKPIKILLSPSKTQTLEPVIFQHPTWVEKADYSDLTLSLLQQLKSYDKVELGKHLQIKGQILDSVYACYQDWDTQATNQAIGLYTGLVFKGLKLQQYSKNQLEYMKSHLCILSAFYGVVAPFDSLKPYRLDMKSKVFETSSYAYWEAAVDAYFKDDDVLVNLASDEFSKLINKPMIHMLFQTTTETGELMVKSTHAKMARGQMADFAITHQIKKVEAFKEFEWNGYTYHKELSSPNRYVFVQK